MSKLASMKQSNRMVSVVEQWERCSVCAGIGRARNVSTQAVEPCIACEGNKRVFVSMTLSYVKVQPSEPATVIQLVPRASVEVPTEAP